MYSTIKECVNTYIILHTICTYVCACIRTCMYNKLIQVFVRQSIKKCIREQHKKSYMLRLAPHMVKSGLESYLATSLGVLGCGYSRRWSVKGTNLNQEMHL